MDDYTTQPDTQISTNRNEVGEWQELEARFSWSPTHAALLHTNEILVYGGSSLAEEKLDDPEPAEILDLASWEVKKVPMGPVENYDIWCGGHTFLEDGRLLFAGGTREYPTFLSYAGLNKAFIYDPAGKIWEEIEDMKMGRWYPTLIRLPDNSVLAIAGLKESFPRPLLRLQEIYRKDQPWEFMKNEEGKNEKKWFPLYPRLHLLPDGNVFYSGVYNTHFQFPWAFPSALWDRKTGTWKNHGGKHKVQNREEGISLLLALRPDEEYRAEILIAGGGSHNNGRLLLDILNALGLKSLAKRFGRNTARRSAERIDLSQDQPSWQAESSMHFPRLHAIGVLLPNGKVLVVGGMQGHNHYFTKEEFEAAENDSEHGKHGVLHAELYDPQEHTWTLMAPQNHARLYHSTALLLPDGRVISMGGNPYAHMIEKSIEIYSPPYYFRERPAIIDYPAQFGYATDFEIKTGQANSISKVVLLRPEVITHVTNTDQRLVELDCEPVDYETLKVTSPPSPGHLPAGYAMLFVLDKHDVPSQGKFIRLG